MKRPLRKRIWFNKPWPGYLKPEEGFYLPKGWWKLWGRGGDEFDWHTIVLGNPVIGTVVFATRKCTGQNPECAEENEDLRAGGWNLDNDWPIDVYGHNHEDEDDKGVCNERTCLVCREEED
jgi:hypothetical protein